MTRLPATLALGAIAAAALSASASAAPIAFSGAKATFVQQQGGFDFSPARMIDGVTTGHDGWAISTLGGGNPTTSQTALLTLAHPLAAGPKVITFTIYQNWGSAETLGDFSLGYTGAARPSLGGKQTPFNITARHSTGGATFTSAGPGHRAEDRRSANPAQAVYTITVRGDAPITGIYLNAIDDPKNGLATGGPGRSGYADGNFVVTEFTASVVTAAKAP